MFKSIKVGSSKSAVKVVGVFQGEKSPPRGMKMSDADAKAAKAAIATPGFKGEAGEVAAGSAKLAVMGLGKKNDLTIDVCRTIGGRLVRRLDRMGVTAASLQLDAAVDKTVGTARDVGQAVAEGIGLANWRVDFFDGSASNRDAAAGALTIDGTDKAMRDGLKRGLTLADAANYTRRLAATPPNICNPTWMASEARKLARSAGLKCTVIDYKKAQQLGMGGIVNVGKGSKHKPCLIVLEYQPGSGAKTTKIGKGKAIALVGKTITYDTGGYSLKISNGMKGMKYDKNGGMAVLGAMKAISALKPKTPVVALLPTAENMVSDDAYRPDDIITMFNGATVEVTNTDAEGRLVLADALAYACKTYDPKAMVDAATLTGGVVVALGSWCSGVWCNDDKLLSRVQDAADATGERIWRLPLWKDHRDFMRAKHADIWNSGPKRDGHPIQGAAFLSFFVDENVPWAHIDIAGVSAVDSETDLHVTGPTGYGVRLLAELAASWA